MAEVKSRHQAEGAWFESYLVPFLSFFLLFCFRSCFVVVFFIKYISSPFLSELSEGGSAIHVFLVSVYFCHPSTVICQLFNLKKIALHIIFQP